MHKAEKKKTKKRTFVTKFVALFDSPYQENCKLPVESVFRK